MDPERGEPETTLAPTKRTGNAKEFGNLVKAPARKLEIAPFRGTIPQGTERHPKVCDREKRGMERASTDHGDGSILAMLRLKIAENSTTAFARELGVKIVKTESLGETRDCPCGIA